MENKNPEFNRREASEGPVHFKLITIQNLRV